MKAADPSRRAWPLFALFVLVGIGASVPFVLQAYRDIRITWFYRPAQCEVISSSIYNTETRSRSTPRSTSHPELTYQLRVDGRWYTATGFDNMGGRTSAPADADAFQRKQSYPCWYDPRDPSHAVLQRRVYKPFYLATAIPLAFLIIGGSMLSRSLRPVVTPALGGLTHGDTLAVRLHPEMIGAKAAGCLAAAAIVFAAAAVVVFVTVAPGVALVLAAIDGFIIFHLIRTIRGIGIAEPIVEIDREPLNPGDSARVFVRQPGPARFAEFKVSLVCEEQGQRGTRKLHSHLMLKKKDASEVADTLAIDIPPDGPLSKKELQTIVTWKIVVQRKDSADREFVFRVTPKP